MTTLRDPFDNVHKKDIKNKRGEVVAQVDYVGWSQVGDRLDEVGEPWSFSIMALGEDWCHGRLTIGDRHFENVGYAENADQEWKKEALKDAVSDAFKRCAALAGVARYLYDKDSPRPQTTVTRTRAAGTSSPVAPSRPHIVEDLMDVDDEDIDQLHLSNRPSLTHCECGEAWKGQTGDLWHKTAEGAYHRHPDNVKQPRAAGRR